jgi:hypothetical protein
MLNFEGRVFTNKTSDYFWTDDALFIQWLPYVWRLKFDSRQGQGIIFRHFSIPTLEQI